MANSLIDLHQIFKSIITENIRIIGMSSQVTNYFQTMQYEFIASKLFWLFALSFLVTFWQYFSSFMNSSHTSRLLKHSYAFSVVGLCCHPVSLFYCICISQKLARSNNSSPIKTGISFLLEIILAFAIGLDNLPGIKKNSKE